MKVLHSMCNVMNELFSSLLLDTLSYIPCPPGGALTTSSRLILQSSLSAPASVYLWSVIILCCFILLFWYLFKALLDLCAHIEFAKIVLTVYSSQCVESVLYPISIYF